MIFKVTIQYKIMKKFKKKISCYKVNNLNIKFEGSLILIYYKNQFKAQK